MAGGRFLHPASACVCHVVCRDLQFAYDVVPDALPACVLMFCLRSREAPRVFYPPQFVFVPREDARGLEKLLSWWRPPAGWCSHERVLFKNECSLGAVFPLQIQSIAEMVFPPQESVEIIRHQQNLRENKG